MRTELRSAVIMLAMLTLITGVLYPLAITGVAQRAFPRQANGSLIVRGDEVLGSSLIGQPFSDARYFWGRLSATVPAYHGGASSGSNLGPLHAGLINAASARVASLRAADAEAALPVPVNLVTASGSGLDPHISLAAAEYQVRRVARARGLAPDAVRKLVTAHTRGRLLRVFGEPVVNVLELNLALDGIH